VSETFPRRSQNTTMDDIQTWLKGFQIARSSSAPPGSDNKKDVQRSSRVPMAASLLDVGGSRYTSHSDFRHFDQIDWQRTDPMQAVELLKTVLMTRDHFDPIPVQYNSCISYVLESHYKLHKIMASKDREIAKIRQLYERDVLRLEEQAQQSDKRQNHYEDQVEESHLLLDYSRISLHRDTRNLSMDHHDIYHSANPQILPHWAEQKGR
jgi:hypothetical protein